MLKSKIAQINKKKNRVKEEVLEVGRNQQKNRAKIKNLNKMIWIKQRKK